MRSGDDLHEADASSSKSEEEEEEEEETVQKSDSNYGSDSSSRNNTPIEYTEHERAELLRRLDSIKDHILRRPNAAHKPKQQQNLSPIHLHGPSYHHPYPQDPYGFQFHRRQPPNPIPNWYPQMNFHSATPSSYSDMPPYSPVSSHHTALFSPPVINNYYYNNNSSYPSSMSSPRPRGSGGYTRWPSDLDSETTGNAFARGYIKKAVYDSNTHRRRCHPVSGGAPFIACRNCFQLLYLPKKKLLRQNKIHKLQCGACNQAISFTIVDKKLVFSSSNEETDIKVVEEEPIKDATQSIRSESQRSDDEERSKVSNGKQQKEVKSVAKGSKVVMEPAAAPENASLLELFEYSTANRAALAYGMEKLGYIKPDKEESFFKQESVPATETEVSSYNGYSNTDISEDNNRLQSRQGSESTDRNDKSLEVWVNGHLIPEELVSSAEKSAGPIEAGKYWYDYRAGFWGVMGKPCLGIIPPFIEEFSHPMPDNCGAGDSQVYVNGRELHKRDFELLVGRGLPRDKNRSYIVDISGRILDGDSGEELKSLGKLAPTIEKVKHGFGMRVPRSLLAS